MTKPAFTRKKKIKKSRIILLSVIAFIFVFSITSMIVVKVIYDGNFGRADIGEYSTNFSYKDREDYARSVISFKSGNNNLTGYIYGEENDKGLVVIAHGLGGGAESYIEETVYFVDQGWRVFSYDCTGSYSSEGDGTVGLAQSVIDLDSALTYAESNSSFKGLPVMLFGHSWGGYAVTAVLNYEHNISAVVSVAGYNSPTELLVEQSLDMMGAFTYAIYPFLWGYQTMLFGETAWLTAVGGINKADIPVMLMHGENDTVILYDGASIISHKESITSTKTVYKTYCEKYNDGHNNLFGSTEATMYAREIADAYDAMYDKYSGEIPDDVLKDFYANVDRVRINELNSAFMEEINSFFESNI